MINKTSLTASALTLAIVLAPAAVFAQQQPSGTSPIRNEDGTIQGGTSGGVTGRDVSASTYGYGTGTPTGTAVEGGGAATAVDGEASTSTEAKANERRAVQRSVATAQTDDERARSRTRTAVKANETVRSKTVSRYKAQGEKPVKEMTTTVVNADGTVTTRSK